MILNIKSIENQLHLQGIIFDSKGVSVLQDCEMSVVYGAIRVIRNIFPSNYYIAIPVRPDDF